MKKKIRFNLLKDKLIRAQTYNGDILNCSLPEVFSLLAADKVLDFPALQPHQRHAWHSFLAQLAVIAKHKSSLRGEPKDSSEWELILRNLTAQYSEDQPWCLVVEDFQIPAFMQCPISDEGPKFTPKLTPDDLDILVKSKNHDVKQSIALNNFPEDWVFALVTLQTMAGFLGSGNYGIARMNGGFSARPCLGLAPAEGGVGAELFFDVQRMTDKRDQLLESYPDYFQDSDGIALVWLIPWDGKDQIDLRKLDPYFIEICRRVRLVKENGVLSAIATGSKKQRIAAKEQKGNLGDFWTPVNVKDGKALSVSTNGFNYRLLVDLILRHNKFRLPNSMRVEGRSFGRWRLVARSIAGGKGKTEGYHERTNIMLSNPFVSALFKSKERDLLAEIAELQIKEIAEISNALKFGITIAASGGKDSSELENNHPAYSFSPPYIKRLEFFADSRFFSSLENRFVASSDSLRDEYRAEFAYDLGQKAFSLLNEANESVPCPSIYRYRSQAKSKSAFWRYLRRSNSIFNDQPEIFSYKEANNA